MGVNFSTVGANAATNLESSNAAQQTGGPQQTQASGELLAIVQEFGLQDDVSLRQSFLENPPENLALNDLSSLTTKLDSMSGSMADVFSVMLLMAKMAQQNRDAAQQMRDAQQQGQLTEMQLAADKIREAADFALAAGIVSGVMKMASGAISIGGGIKGLKDLKGLGKSPNSGYQFAEESPGVGSKNVQGLGKTPNVDLKLEQIRAQGRIFDGSGQVVSGLGDGIAAGLNRAGEEARAEEKEADARAQEHDHLAQKESDFLSFNRDLIGKVSQIMRDLIQLNADAERSAATI
jgi:hypothetical protein